MRSRRWVRRLRSARIALLVAGGRDAAAQRAAGDVGRDAAALARPSSHPSRVAAAPIALRHPAG